MRDKIMDIFVITAFTIIVILFCVVGYFALFKPSNSAYLYEYVADNGTVYLITYNGICPLYNADGSIYIKSAE